jgi:IS4 transposase
MLHTVTRSRRLVRRARLLAPLVVVAGVPLAVPALASTSSTGSTAATLAATAISHINSVTARHRTALKSNAVQVYNDDVPALGIVGGVRSRVADTVRR